ncbi:MAG: sigma-E processing peptidase SpoIIGA [Oscillospiraceae bacterium]
MQSAYPVYVDVLFLVNFIIDFLLLSLACKFSGRKHRTLRLILAAAVGGIGSMIIFLPPMHSVLQIIINVILSAIMVLTANPVVQTSQFLKEWFIFLLISFTAGGLMYGIFTVFNPQQMTIYNGVVYFDISAFILLFNIAVIYLVICLFDKLLKGNCVPGTHYTVELSLLGKEISLTGMVDTGNRLKDLFSDSPVMICSFDSVKNILPVEVSALLLSNDLITTIDFDILPPEAAQRFRVIPYNGVNSGGILPAFKVDYVKLTSGSQSFIVEDALAAICTHSIGGGYDVLLNPKMIPINIKGTVNVL